MKIAIISFNHPESSLVLAKHLSDKGVYVDYYYITSLWKDSTSAFNFGIKARRPGLIKINKKINPVLSEYLKSSFLTINLITLIGISIKFLFIEKYIIKYVSKEILRTNYDLVNMVGQHELLLNFHKSLSTIKRVHTLHEISSHYSNNKNDDKLIDFIDKSNIPVIVHSNCSFKRACDVFKNKSNRQIEIVPFGLFETYKLFEKSSIAPLCRYALWYGFIREYKGLEVLKKAVDLLPEDLLLNFKFVIAGSGESAILDEIKNDSRFIIINKYLTNEDIVALNSQASFVICPYTSASQSGIISTTFLFDKPIIASDVGAFGEFIIDGENGLLVAPNNPIELAMKIELLLKDEDLYKNLSKGVKNFSKRFDWKILSEKTLKLYNRVINEKKQFDNYEI